MSDTAAHTGKLKNVEKTKSAIRQIFFGAAAGPWIDAETPPEAGRYLVYSRYSGQRGLAFYHAGWKPFLLGGKAITHYAVINAPEK